MADTDTFESSRVAFEALVGFFAGPEAAGLAHAHLEARLKADGFEVLRQVLQDHFDLRAATEERHEAPVGSDGRPRPYVEAAHTRALVTIFGQVSVTRLAYRAKCATNLFPADAASNLPAEVHSHGLRELAAIEAARGSFEGAKHALDRGSGASVAKRQVEDLARAAAVDFEAYYATANRPVAEPGQVVVLSADGKGIVMRPEGLRAATAAKAARSKNKLNGRLSKGEKANRKRMAEVGAVYVVEPVPRTPSDVMARSDGPRPTEAPKAKDKWLTASVANDAATVIAGVFAEAERRDPDHSHDWVALVDGNRHQIERIEVEAAARNITVTIVVDWVHVLEYLWSAAWSFFAEGDPDAEEWVQAKSIEILSGRASIVAAAIRRKATALGLDAATRKNADTCADYLLAKAAYLVYPTALASGWPIATGVIEGAVRHVVKDRMDITGARWGLEGAEAVLKLRALRSNDAWEDYWAFHLANERRRVHESRYLDGAIPTAA
ncbi:MAG: ISKra4 family transposase [Acidimicrobiales bacterium]